MRGQISLTWNVRHSKETVDLQLFDHSGMNVSNLSGCSSRQLRIAIDGSQSMLSTFAMSTLRYTLLTPVFKILPLTLEKPLAHRLSDSDVRNPYSSQSRHFQIESE